MSLPQHVSFAPLLQPTAGPWGPRVNILRLVGRANTIGYYDLRGEKRKSPSLLQRPKRLRGAYTYTYTYTPPRKSLHSPPQFNQVRNPPQDTISISP